MHGDPGDPLAKYRCRHGRLFLGCSHDDCPEQNAYLAEQFDQLERWEIEQRLAARAVVRAELGLKP